MTERPKRLLRSRRKGYRLPPGTIVVTRPTQWANPFRVSGPNPSHNIEGRAEAVRQFVERFGPDGAELDLEPLRGHNLACYCALDGGPCHADVLIEWANRR